MSATPIERAAEAFEFEWDSTVEAWDPEKATMAEFIAGCVRKALTAALDRDELIEVLNSPQHAPESTHSGRDGSCVECPWPLHALPPDRIADAVIEFLLGGAS